MVEGHLMLKISGQRIKEIYMDVTTVGTYHRAATQKL